MSLMDTQPVLAALIALLGLGITFGAILGFASIRFRTEGNSLADQINQILPQTQCGQCGYPGCKPYATAIAEGDVLIQALLQLDLEFIQHLCGRVFGFHAPNDGHWSPYCLNRAALEILAACAWREGGHFVEFEAEPRHHNYPTGLRGFSARPNTKSVTSLIWWANRNYAGRCSAKRERQRLLELVR